MSHSINVRDATSEDAAAIATLGAHVFSTTFGYSVSPEDLSAFLEENYSTTAIAKDLANPARDMIVATTAEDIITGFAILARETHEPCVEHLESKIELQRIYVDPAHHGNGVGKALAKRIEDMAREQGYVNMWLGVWEDNHKAQKVYEKLGYKVIGDHDFVIGRDIQTDHIMLKSL